jgi:cytidylate kinase
MPTVAEKLDSSRLSVVVVVGPTGVGKSKLSVDLARRLGGECVNADALQVYAGLDVTTNKATSEEKAGTCTMHPQLALSVIYTSWSLWASLTGYVVVQVRGAPPLDGLPPA